MRAQILTLVAMVVCATVSASCLTQLQQVRALKVCNAVPVEVSAFLNASRHDAWLSDAAGSMKNAVRLAFPTAAPDASVKRVKNYIWRPQDYTKKTFHARFYGVVSCDAEGGRAITVYRADDIVLSPIK